MEKKPRHEKRYLGLENFEVTLMLSISGLCYRDVLFISLDTQVKKKIQDSISYIPLKIRGV